MRNTHSERRTGIVTDFVTRLGQKRKEKTGRDRNNGTLEAIETATNFGETVRITSFCENGSFSLLISGPLH
jgi:hypothetical protein